MALLGGLVGKIVGAVILVVLLVVVVVVFAYASDYGVEATVTKKQCTGAAPFATVVTKLFSMSHDVELEPDKCSIVRVGNFVTYHLRTGHTTIYEKEGGRCLYDTKTIVC